MVISLSLNEPRKSAPIDVVSYTAGILMMLPYCTALVIFSRNIFVYSTRIKPFSAVPLNTHDRNNERNDFRLFHFPQTVVART